MTSKSFVLVHGFTQSPSGWDRLRPHLEEMGHETLIVDLRMEELADAGGRECARAIAEVVERATYPVHLVGTSGSGSLTPLVPSLTAVECLVFICSGLPDVGRSLVEQIDKDGVLTDEWITEPDTSGLDAAGRFMFNDCDEATKAWGLTTFRIFNPPRVYEEATPLKEWPDVEMLYILGTHDRIISPEWSRNVVPVRLGVTPIELDSGHCPQASMPRELATLLLSEALHG